MGKIEEHVYFNSYVFWNSIFFTFQRDSDGIV